MSKVLITTIPFGDQEPLPLKMLKESNIDKLDKVFALLDDAKVFGTLPFAHLARSAFIAVSLLNSAVSNSIISIKEREDFLNSIRTVSHDLTIDALNCKKGKLEWNEFVERYGHLRPGTYDILSYSYKNDPERYLKPLLNQSSNHLKGSNSNVGKLWRSSKKDFLSALEKVSLPHDTELVENFLRSSIEGREYAKFIFSRNLSFALDLLGEWAAEQGVDLEVMSHISIAEIRDAKSDLVNRSYIGKWLREKASFASSQHPLVEAIELPPLICNRDAFSFFEYPSTQPNFIGFARVTARVVNLDQDETIDDLIDKNEFILEQKLEEWIENGKEYPIIMKKFNRYLEKKEKNDVINKIKQEIKLILFNNRKIISSI